MFCIVFIVEATLNNNKLDSAICTQLTRGVTHHLEVNGTVYFAAGDARHKQNTQRTHSPL